MTTNRIESVDQIPEADRLDQQTPLDDEEFSDLAASEPDQPIDEGDLFEQHQPVPLAADEDHPHDQIDAHWFG